MILLDEKALFFIHFIHLFIHLQCGLLRMIYLSILPDLTVSYYSKYLWRLLQSSNKTYLLQVVIQKDVVGDFF